MGFHFPLVEAKPSWFILKFRIQPKSESFDFEPLRIWIYSFKFAITYEVNYWLPGLLKIADDTPALYALIDKY